MVQSNMVNSNLQQPTPSKINEYKQYKEKNKQDMTTSVLSLNGFYKEQMEGYNFDYTKSDHPSVALFHFAIKGIALAVYLFGGLFIREAWTLPEIVIVIGAVDFWVTKNITGRLLVGLRWWEEIDEASGEQLWVFETRVNENQVSQVNSFIFWATLVLAILAWGFLAVVNAIGFHILNLTGISFQLTIQIINFYFYFQCSRVAKTRAKQLAKVLGAEILNKMMNQSVIWPMKVPKQKGL
ncbi:unnamed protein product [Paramecium octaurelia]|uniref:Golgi apparatus membrane protein TVP23 homolog n=1 Tax=Paramecium octaurelia TaxID=43137 RepID=A0A8S1UBN8_PAROT|nr:unnamed protein product [Paramecium octaurelia]